MDSIHELLTRIGKDLEEAQSIFATLPEEYRPEILAQRLQQFQDSKKQFLLLLGTTACVLNGRRHRHVWHHQFKARGEIMITSWGHQGLTGGIPSLMSFERADIPLSDRPTESYCMNDVADAASGQFYRDTCDLLLKVIEACVEWEGSVSNTAGDISRFSDRLTTALSKLGG